MLKYILLSVIETDVKSESDTNNSDKLYDKEYNFGELEVIKM